MVIYVLDRGLLQIFDASVNLGWFNNRDTEEWYKEKVTFVSRKSTYLFP
jgi:hypothetical protein